MAKDLNVDQIKKLWILDLVISQGSLKKASLHAKVTPSAISQSITSLEQAYGKPLLIREKGSARPTQDALLLLQVVRPAFAAFARLKDMSETPIPKMSWMNFGTYESIAIDLLPGLIYNLRQKLPNLRLGLRISRTANLLTMVRKGELCSALITEVDELDKFYTREVAEDYLGIYVSNQSPVSREGWRAIEKFGWGSLVPAKDGMPRYFTKFLRHYELAKPIIQSDSFETLRAAAAAGSIAAVLPSRVAKRHNDLLEIFPMHVNERSIKNVGHHRILVVSQSNCDRLEADFIAEEARNLLHPV